MDIINIERYNSENPISYRFPVSYRFAWRDTESGPDGVLFMFDDGSEWMVDGVTLKIHNDLSPLTLVDYWHRLADMGFRIYRAG